MYLGPENLQKQNKNSPSHYSGDAIEAIRLKAGRPQIMKKKPSDSSAHTRGDGFVGLIRLIDSVLDASDAAQPFQLSIVNTRSNKSAGMTRKRAYLAGL